MTFRNDLLGTDFVEVPTPTSWSTAATADEWPAWTCPASKRYKVTAVKLVPATAITASATDTVTVSVQNKGAAGTGTTEVASFAFDTATTDDVAAFDEKALTLSGTAASLVVTAGQILSIKKAVAAAGQIVEGKIRIEFEPVGA